MKKILIDNNRQKIIKNTIEIIRIELLNENIPLGDSYINSLLDYLLLIDDLNEEKLVRKGLIFIINNYYKSNIKKINKIENLNEETIINDCLELLKPHTITIDNSTKNVLTEIIKTMKNNILDNIVVRLDDENSIIYEIKYLVYLTILWYFLEHTKK